MNGAITDLEHLKRWFFGNGHPYFFINYQGAGNRKIYQNESIEEMQEAWEELEYQVKSQTGHGRAMLEVVQYAKGKQNHPVRTYIDMRSDAQAQGTAMAGIGNFPAQGYPANYVQDQIKMALMEKELEDMRAALESPSNVFENIVDKIGQSPHLSGLVNNLVSALFGQKGAVPSMPVNGHPGAQQPTAQATQPEAGTEATGEEMTPERIALFQSNIDRICTALETDPINLSSKLAALVEGNPDLAKNLLNSSENG